MALSKAEYQCTYCNDVFWKYRPSDPSKGIEGECPNCKVPLHHHIARPVINRTIEQLSQKVLTQEEIWLQHGLDINDPQTIMDEVKKIKEYYGQTYNGGQ